MHKRLSTVLRHLLEIFFKIPHNCCDSMLSSECFRSVLLLEIQLSKRGGVGISLISVSLPHFCACPKPWLRFLTSYVVVFFMLYDLRCEMVVHFVVIVVDIGHNS